MAMKLNPNKELSYGNTTSIFPLRKNHVNINSIRDIDIIL
jgi:hypothetical protein